MQISYRTYAAKADRLYAELSSSEIGALTRQAEARRRELFELAMFDSQADLRVAGDFKRATVLAERGRSALDLRALASGSETASEIRGMRLRAERRFAASAL